MVKVIRETMENPKEKVYKIYKREFDSRINELEKEKSKIMRKKKNKKEKVRLLKMIMIERIKIMSTCVKHTFNHYKKLYSENDYYR